MMTSFARVPFKKLLIICGPTATGKTSLGIKLAKKFQGEIISADSRQVYKGMDVGTGKDLPENSKLILPVLRTGKTQNSKQNIDKKFTVGCRLKNKIPIWLVDIVDPSYQFNVGEFQRLAKMVIDDIFSRGKLVILVGGTGLYIKSVLEPLSLMQIPPNLKLRKYLDNKTREELAAQLQEIDPVKWKIMNYSDRLNSRRLIRAIEIAQYTESLKVKILKKPDHYQVLIIGLDASKKLLEKRINQRVLKRANSGMDREIRRLIDSGFNWDNSILASTIGYREWKNYHQGLAKMEDSIKAWQKAEQDYAKRQMVWFQKQKNIIWFDIARKNFAQDIEKKVTKWYTSK